MSEFGRQVIAQVGQQTGFVADIGTGAVMSTPAGDVVDFINSLIQGNEIGTGVPLGMALTPGSLDKMAGDLISGALKASRSYRSELAQKTYREIIALSKGKGPVAHAARQMKKLIEQSRRLHDKPGKPR